ncbi:hypothetical protein ACFW15_33235, partial [Streptomyces sp. NPDC058953]
DERALDVLQPFIEAGWNRAPGEGRRPARGREGGAGTGDEEGLAPEWVWHDFAALLYEAMTVLAPHLEKGRILSALVDLAQD